jgi:hypothetical protein
MLASAQVVVKKTLLAIFFATWQIKANFELQNKSKGFSCALRRKPSQPKTAGEIWF